MALKYCNFKGACKRMDAFETELMRRSPLAASVLEISDFIFDERVKSL